MTFLAFIDLQCTQMILAVVAITITCVQINNNFIATIKLGNSQLLCDVARAKHVSLNIVPVPVTTHVNIAPVLFVTCSNILAIPVTTTYKDDMRQAITTLLGI